MKFTHDSVVSLESDLIVEKNLLKAAAVDLLSKVVLPSNQYLKV